MREADPSKPGAEQEKASSAVRGERYERPLLREHGGLRDLTAQKSGEKAVLRDASDVSLKEHFLAIVWE